MLHPVNNNKSINTTWHCGTDSTVTGSRIFLASIELCTSLFCLFIVLYLTLRLKKRAWHSSLKRLSHFFTLNFASTFLIYAVLNFSIHYWCSDWQRIVALYIVPFPFAASFLYFSASLVAQLLAMCTPERLKEPSLLKNICVIITEVTFHVLTFVIALIFCIANINTFEYYYKYTKHRIYEYAARLLVTILGFILYFLPFIFVSSSVILGCCFVRSLRRNTVNQKKVLKLIFLIIISVIGVFVTALVVFDDAEHSGMVTVFVLYYFFMSVSVTSLNYPLQTWYCKYSSRNSQGFEPVLTSTEDEYME